MFLLILKGKFLKYFHTKSCTCFTKEPTSAYSAEHAFGNDPRALVNEVADGVLLCTLSKPFVNYHFHAIQLFAGGKIIAIFRIF